MCILKAAAAVFCLVLVVVSSPVAAAAAAADDCKPVPENHVLPNSLCTGTCNGLVIWTEVTSSQEREKLVVRETYARELNRYSIEFVNHDTGTTEKLLHDRENKLVYWYSDDSGAGCVATFSNQTDEIYSKLQLFKLLQLEKMPNEGYLGAASVFEQLANADRGQVKLCPSEVSERHIDSTVYRLNETLFYFAQDNATAVDEDNQRPLLARLDGGITIDVVSIERLNQLDLFVPTGLSCANPTGADVVPFDIGRRGFESEIVITTWATNHTYVSQLGGVIVPAFGSDADPDPDNAGLPALYMFDSRSFPTELSTRATHSRLIHDVTNGIVYKYTRVKSDNSSDDYDASCQVFKDNELLSAAQIELPIFGKLPVDSLFLGIPKNKTNKKVSFLGQNRMRSVLTDVYEVTFSNYPTGSGIELSRLVATFHFDQTNLKLRAIELNGYEKSSKNFTAVMHVVNYSNNVAQLNELFRIDKCYDASDKSQLRWLQLGFVLNSTFGTEQAKQSVLSIERAFLEKLYARFDVRPMRVPLVNVDVLDEQVLISALFVERPMLESAFDSLEKKQFKQGAKVLGVMSRDNCMSTCLGMKQECAALSYCGATCSVSRAKDSVAPVNLIDSDDCVLYERGPKSTLKVTSEIFRDINLAVTANDSESLLVISATSNSGRGRINLIADTYDDTKNYDDAFHFDENKVAVIKSLFEIEKSSMRIKSSSAQATTIGTFDLDFCARACKNRPECESLSYCENSRECILSSVHSVDKDDLTEDSHCIVYSKRYLERFEKFPGLTVKAAGTRIPSQNVGDCSHRCVKDQRCLSFEYCESDRECILLTSHIANMPDAAKKHDKAECAHYSKRYIYDYERRRHAVAAEQKLLAHIKNINQEECAKTCSESDAKGKECVAFNFCAEETDNTGQCSLLTKGLADSNVNASNVCDFFYTTVSRKVTIHGKQAGSVIGSSILMILVGIAIGFAGFFLYQKYRPV